MRQTADVDLSNWIALVSTIIAVLAIVAGIWAARRYGNRRRKLVFEWSASPLIPEAQADPSGHLAVTYRDIPVADPYLLTLELVNVGPADVASSHFDGERSITVNLGCTITAYSGHRLAAGGSMSSCRRWVPLASSS